jgi:hypothetical protein
MSIVNGDLLDEGLQNVMGKDRCQNDWKPSKKPMADKKSVDASWEPVKEHTWMDTLKNCATWAVGFGGLSFLIFYWEQAGLMAESIATPLMCICTTLAGWGVGKNIR